MTTQTQRWLENAEVVGEALPVQLAVAAKVVVSRLRQYQRETDATRKDARMADLERAAAVAKELADLVAR